MAEEEKRSERETRREVGSLVLEAVREASSAIEAAKNTGEVVCALYSLAVRLFPLDSSLLADSLDERYRIQVLDSRIPNDAEREEWRNVFYCGAAFPAMANILLYNVASNWLARFPLSARDQVYDSFFIRGPSIEILQALIPSLQHSGTSKDVGFNAVCSNVERLLVLCLLDKEGVYHMVGEFGLMYGTDEHVDVLLKPKKSIFISRVAQLLASVPDKTRHKASCILSSHLFFQKIVIQLLLGAEERAMELCINLDVIDPTNVDSAFLFVGETFARICRRGSAGDENFLDLLDDYEYYMPSVISDYSIIIY